MSSWEHWWDSYYKWNRLSSFISIVTVISFNSTYTLVIPGPPVSLLIFSFFDEFLYDWIHSVVELLIWNTVKLDRFIHLILCEILVFFFFFFGSDRQMVLFPYSFINQHTFSFCAIVAKDKLHSMSYYKQNALKSSKGICMICISLLLVNRHQWPLT